MDAKSRAEYIENTIETLRSKELNDGPHAISDFDKIRLSSSVGILLYEGLAANSAATKELTQALQQSSMDLQAASAEGANAAKKLNQLTVVVVVSAVLSLFVTCWQGYQTKRQADLAQMQLISKPPSTSPQSAVPLPANPSLPRKPN
jgi:hypothetical protein